MGTPGMNVEAMNIDEESDGYLITMNFDIDLQMELMCELTSSYLYSLHSNIKKGEVLDQYIYMSENLLYLVNKNALLEKIESERMNGQDEKEGIVLDGVSCPSPPKGILMINSIQGMSLNPSILLNSGTFGYCYLQR